MQRVRGVGSCSIHKQRSARGGRKENTTKREEWSPPSLPGTGGLCCCTGMPSWQAEGERAPLLPPLAVGQISPPPPLFSFPSLPPSDRNYPLGVIHHLPPVIFVSRESCPSLATAATVLLLSPRVGKAGACKKARTAKKKMSVVLFRGFLTDIFSPDIPAKK